MRRGANGPPDAALPSVAGALASFTRVFATTLEGTTRATAQKQSTVTTLADIVVHSASLHNARVAGTVCVICDGWDPEEKPRLTARVHLPRDLPAPFPGRDPSPMSEPPPNQQVNRRWPRLK